MNAIKNIIMREIKLDELYDGNFYHVCTEGLETDVIIRDEEDFIVARNYLALSAWSIKVDILVFCLMSNHIHALLGAESRNLALKYIRHFKQIYSTYLHNKYGRDSALKGQFESIALISDLKYLRNCIAYILRNPVSARVCSKVDEYLWSSYGAYFRVDSSNAYVPITNLKGRLRRKVLRTGMNLDNCPYYIDDKGNISAESFVRSDLVHLAFNKSGKLFLYYLGICNDAQMEYELVNRPLVQSSDQDLLTAVETVIAQRFKKNVAQLTTGEKCSVLKYLFFNFKSTVPQLSRILGLSRELIRKVLST